MTSQTHTTRKEISITIDETSLSTNDEDMEASVLLRLADRDPHLYDLARVKKDGELQVFRDGKVIDLKDGDSFVSVIFGVKVNGQLVAIDKRKQTGASLKSAAVAAGVPIQVDFVLSRVLDSGEQPVVADDAEITVKYHDEFWAIPGDDNS